MRKTALSTEIRRALRNQQMTSRKWVAYNPKDLPVDQLPCIYCFANGGQVNLLNAIALAQDGSILGSHACSHEDYIPSDLGVLEGCRNDRHKNSYMKHYPDGYKMIFVPYSMIERTKGLVEAIRNNRIANQKAITEARLKGE